MIILSIALLANTLLLAYLAYCERINSNEIKNILESNFKNSFENFKIMTGAYRTSADAKNSMNSAMYDMIRDLHKKIVPSAITNSKIAAQKPEKKVVGNGRPRTQEEKELASARMKAHWDKKRAEEQAKIAVPQNEGGKAV